MTDEFFERLESESRARRLAHPDWPSHRPTLYEPGGKITVFEEMPVGRLTRTHKGACKYCYRTHRNWWLMDQRNYSLAEPEIESGEDAVLLCGECEHTSRAIYAGVDPPFALQRARGGGQTR